jgi:hypothetical protein
MDMAYNFYLNFRLDLDDYNKEVEVVAILRPWRELDEHC